MSENFRSKISYLTRLRHASIRRWYFTR